MSGLTPQEARMLLAIAAAPDDVSLRHVLADQLSERGNPWGDFIQAELQGLTSGVRHLATAAGPTLRAGLGLGARGRVHTHLGFPVAVDLADLEPDVTLPAWALVERLHFGSLGPRAPALLAAGQASHGWPRLVALGELTVEALGFTRPWGLAKLRALNLTSDEDVPASALLPFLAPRPVAVELQGYHRLAVVRAGPSEVRVGQLFSAAPHWVADQLLLELLVRVVVNGDELVWSNRPASTWLAARLPGALPRHTSRVTSAWRPIIT